MWHVTNLPCPLSHSISFSASYDLFIVCPIIEYVEITIEVPAFGLSFASEVNLAIISSVAVDHILNCARHCYEIIEFILIFMKTHLDSNTRCTQDNATFSDCGTSSDTNQGFTSTTWKNNYTRSCTTITKHFLQRLFLIRSVFLFQIWLDLWEILKVPSWNFRD